MVRNAAYADVTKALSIEVDMTPAVLADFYKAALGKAGWRATTGKPVKIDFDEVMIFRNDEKDIVTLKMHPFEGKLNAVIVQQTEAEYDEIIRLAKAEQLQRKAEAAQYAMKAAANDRDVVRISIPSGATQLKRTSDRIDFKIAAGSGKGAVEAIYADLIKNGWTGDAKPLEAIGGSVIVSKKLGARATVAIIYVDTGAADAEIAISAVGANFESPKAK